VIAFTTLILEADEEHRESHARCAKCEESQEFSSAALTAAEALLGIINQVRLRAGTCRYLPNTRLVTYPRPLPFHHLLLPLHLLRRRCSFLFASAFSASYAASSAPHAGARLHADGERRQRDPVARRAQACPLQHCRYVRPGSSMSSTYLVSFLR
jgi:hypothetical protein